MAEDEIRAQVNRLYWSSDASVGDIAGQVGLSRRALYDAIEPRPAGRPCPECGSALGFRNRTAMENRQAECAECGHKATLAEGPPLSASTPRAAGADDAVPSAPDTGPAGADAASSRPPPSERPSARRRTAPAADTGPDDPEVEREEEAGGLSPTRRVPAGQSGAVAGAALLAGIGLGAVLLYLTRRR